MKLFVCTSCSNIVHFENTTCGACGSRLGYSHEQNAMVAADLAREETAQKTRRAIGVPKAEFRFCANADWDACNWIIPAGRDDTFCAACRHNHTIPDLSIDENLVRWRKLEFAKHHLFYSLMRLRLPTETRQQQPMFGLTFEFLGDAPGATVLTGHDEGIITLNLVEADDAIREKRRTDMGEPYRTLLGHFRHETGHYYWDRLVRDRNQIEAARGFFGDESQDYNESLKTYYASGPAPNWWDNYVSAYASAHPWEDFAETWAHYLHIIDTLEMAASYGLKVNPGVTEDPALSAVADFDPYLTDDLEQIINRWRPIAIAVNSINRCMGQPDLYPFVLTPAVIGKLGFIHGLVHRLG